MANGWIDIGDKMPKELQRVLLLDTDKDIFIGFLHSNSDTNFFTSINHWDVDAIAWQPLPKNEL